MQYKKKFINDKILEAGKVEYLEKSFRTGNISTIAENAGVPVGNLYRYFDGKSGLLDAIVKPAYNELPKMIANLADISNDENVSLEQLMRSLSDQLLVIFDDYGKEIIILVDKCATTRYEDFAEEVIKQVSNIVRNKLYGVENTEFGNYMSTLISKAFINSIFDILRLNLPRAQMQEVVLRILKFYFFEVDNRK